MWASMPWQNSYNFGCIIPRERQHDEDADCLFMAARTRTRRGILESCAGIKPRRFEAQHGAQRALGLVWFGRMVAKCGECRYPKGQLFRNNHGDFLCRDG